MSLPIRARILGVLTPLALAAAATGPAIAHASTTTTPSRTDPTLNRFYTGFEHVSVYTEKRRLGAQTALLRPFYAALATRSHNLSTSAQGALRATVSETVRVAELEPTIVQEQQTAKTLLHSTSGASRRDVTVLQTYFADELAAARALPGITAWEQTSFASGEPAAITRLTTEINRHPHQIDPLQQDNPFGLLQNSLTAAQRHQLDRRIREISFTLTGLSNITYQETGSWEEGQPGFPLS